MLSWMKLISSLLVIALLQATRQTSPEPTDKYQWLEDVYGERSLAWVKAENERSAKVIESDPRFAELETTALKVLESPQRLPDPNLNGTEVYNTWHDAAHVRGILRRTSLTDYLTPQPHWQTVLDYDELNKRENAKWVPRGMWCLYPGDQYCLAALSAGGEDAVTLREFDLKAAKFVDRGFTLDRSKQSVVWADKDTLLVARDWGAGTMTKSGYPFVVKLWKRGELLEQAKEIYRGTPNDMECSPVVLNDGDGHHFSFLNRKVNFFESEAVLPAPGGPKRIGLPGKARIEGLVKGQIIVSLDEDWRPAGRNGNISQGSIVSLDMKAVEADPANLKPSIVFAPTKTEFAQRVEATKNRLIVATLDNVQGRAYSFSLNAKGDWIPSRLNIPDNRTVGIATTNWSDNQFFLEVAGFLSPSSLLLGDADTGAVKEVKALLPQFDSSRETVDQLEAVSKDGTKVPYFVVRRKEIKYDGLNPTLLTAYGGFQIPETPAYTPTIGKLWLERGGVFVSANIRGGGEFGPAWHEAGLKTHRQRIYDDFAAVAEDLIKRKITSSRRLGIEGTSNGGLLVGVEMIQHPKMWNAVVIRVPLLDMLRFEQIAAGASWVAEYGSVTVPEQRAFLASISPYNQLKADVTYPEPLIFTTTKDDRVGPVHARKFAAKMEEFRKPFFYQEIVEGGHSSGADLKERAKTSAFEYTYLSRKLMD